MKEELWSRLAALPGTLAGPLQITAHDCNRNCNGDPYLYKSTLQGPETGTAVVCGTCTIPSASFHASAASLHANAGTVVATGTFPKPFNQAFRRRLKWKL
jgi:hypothetical protein